MHYWTFWHLIQNQNSTQFWLWCDFYWSWVNEIHIGVFMRLLIYNNLKLSCYLFWLSGGLRSSARAGLPGYRRVCRLLLRHESRVFRKRGEEMGAGSSPLRRADAVHPRGYAGGSQRQLLWATTSAKEPTETGQLRDGAASGEPRGRELLRRVLRAHSERA